MSDNAQRGYLLATYISTNPAAASVEQCLDDWMTIWQQRGETLPAGARFIFEVWPGAEGDPMRIEVRCRIVLAEPEQWA